VVDDVRNTDAGDLEDNQHFERVLANHRDDQERLTEDLLSMAQNLKSNAQTFGDLLKKDAQVRLHSSNANCCRYWKMQRMHCQPTLEK